SIGQGNVTVTGAGTRANPYAVEFKGTLAGASVDSLTLNSAALVDTASATASVTSDSDATNAQFEISVTPQDESSTLDTTSGNIIVSWGPSPPSGQGGADPSRSVPINLGPLATQYRQLQTAQNDLAQATEEDDAAGMAAAQAAINTANQQI